MHTPIVVTVLCAACVSDVETLLKTNLGPLLQDGSVRCVPQPDRVACDVYVPWSTACDCCKQLRETFAEGIPAASSLLAENLYSPAVMPPPPPPVVHVDCTIPRRYHACA